jgi:hypothetical protein
VGIYLRDKLFITKPHATDNLRQATGQAFLAVFRDYFINTFPKPCARKGDMSHVFHNADLFSKCKDIYKARTKLFILIVSILWPNTNILDWQNILLYMLFGFELSKVFLWPPCKATEKFHDNKLEVTECGMENI